MCFIIYIFQVFPRILRHAIIKNPKGVCMQTENHILMYHLLYFILLNTFVESYDYADYESCYDCLRGDKVVSVTSAISLLDDLYQLECCVDVSAADTRDESNGFKDCYDNDKDKVKTGDPSTSASSCIEEVFNIKCIDTNEPESEPGPEPSNNNSSGGK
ncbi:unnamed protein product [Cunninghamella echinulata]